MQYSLTEDQKRIQERARQFANQVVAPHAAANAAAARFPHEILTQAAAEGFLGLLVPPEFGGNGLGNFALTLVLEELNRVCASTGVTVSVHNSLVSNPLRHFGSPALKSEYLPRLARGEVLGAYCLTEPHSGSDAAALATTARRDGDAWILNGTKFFITTGAEAGLYIVFARTDPTQKTRGITAFVVERAFAGVAVGKEEIKMGLTASHTVEVLLQDCRVPARNMLGTPGEGFRIAMHTLDGGRIGIAAQAVGIAQAALDAAARYAIAHATVRGRLAESQAIQNRLADMATDVEAARHLTYNAARLREAGLPCGQEAAMAKLFASRTCNAAAREALQIVGLGNGNGASADVERFVRDARVTELYEGTTEIQKIVVARAVLKKYQV
jgi:acyl-CoA dehydrogenase